MFVYSFFFNQNVYQNLKKYISVVNYTSLYYFYFWNLSRENITTYQVRIFVNIIFVTFFLCQNFNTDKLK